MYKRNTDNWLKHLDFIILDLVSLQVAYYFAYVASGYGCWPYGVLLYRDMAFFLLVVDVLILVLFNALSEVLRRGPYREFLVTVRHVAIVAGLSILYLFLLQQGQNFSRLCLVLTFLLYLPLSYMSRMLWKRHLSRRMEREGDCALLLVTDSSSALRVSGLVADNNYSRYKLAGFAIVDKDMVGESIGGLPVVCTATDLIPYLCHEWIDEALVVISGNCSFPKSMVQDIAETGVVVHYGIANQTRIPGMKQFVEEVGGIDVITTSMNYASTGQLFLKRLIDIAAGIVGSIMAVGLALILGPLIYASSPGPILYIQERVGKNGRRFKMYKFRSMRLDADEKKAELLGLNKIDDPKMFKMDFDPRVIGNEVLRDGTTKTGIGDFIRRTSLDEFPQFFNVLKGEMSVVGTRPPLVSEAALYESHHRARLAIKPGITGMWQVNGRSDITDFEEVVRLDREYINNWSIKLDIKILIKTIGVVLRGEGSA